MDRQTENALRESVETKLGASLVATKMDDRPGMFAYDGTMTPAESEEGDWERVASLIHGEIVGFMEQHGHSTVSGNPVAVSVSSSGGTVSFIGVLSFGKQ